MSISPSPSCFSPKLHHAVQKYILYSCEHQPVWNVSFVALSRYINLKYCFVYSRNSTRWQEAQWMPVCLLPVVLFPSCHCFHQLTLNFHLSCGHSHDCDSSCVLPSLSPDRNISSPEGLGEPRTKAGDLLQTRSARWCKCWGKKKKRKTKHGTHQADYLTGHLSQHMLDPSWPTFLLYKWFLFLDISHDSLYRTIMQPKHLIWFSAVRWPTGCLN